MIEKKRLEELIEQCATIYKKRENVVFDYNLKKGNYVEDNELMFCNRKTYYEVFVGAIEDLFETKEEAEWHKEFGCIERTERLELPTWEEFKKDGEFSFLDKQGFEWDLYSPDDETRISLVGGYDHYEFDYTKENYTLACRKCKELFLGEKK